ncbi:hypothetical protein DYB28_001852 [Aphanomyces astaci]|uniref:Uncharacterized protein n=1 Tax=Aphanomyces astaci TaxID=112090 RepID=A0A9X8DQI4_APHAT|nr:hypothetical protein DYB28_001852 [Aphanomyces astaci]
MWLLFSAGFGYCNGQLHFQLKRANAVDLFMDIGATQELTRLLLLEGDPPSKSDERVVCPTPSAPPTNNVVSVEVRTSSSKGDGTHTSSIGHRCHGVHQFVTRLAQRLSASQDRIAKLGRIEKAIADFHGEVVALVGHLDSSSADDKATAVPPPSITTDGDTLALVHSLRMYMRMQLAFRDDYEATLKASLKTVSSAKHKYSTQDRLTTCCENGGHRDELSAKAHVAQLTLERDALLVHNQTLSKQMDETEAVKALVAVQSMQALEQSRAATEHVLHQLADVRVELKTALDTVGPGRWQAAQLDDKEQANGLLTQKIESLMRNTHGGGGDQQSKGRVEGGGAAVGGNMKGVSSLDADMRQANLKISHLEAENHANRDQIKDLKAKLQGYLGSAHAVAFTQAQKDATRFKERVKDVEGKLAAAEAVVMKTRGQLAEKGTRLQALQSDKKQAATYVTGFYRTKLEHQAAEILGLRKQIKKMLTLQHQTYFDHSLHKKEHLRLLTRACDIVTQCLLHHCTLEMVRPAKLTGSNWCDEISSSNGFSGSIAGMVTPSTTIPWLGRHLNQS